MGTAPNKPPGMPSPPDFSEAAITKKMQQIQQLAKLEKALENLPSVPKGDAVDRQAKKAQSNAVTMTPAQTQQVLKCAPKVPHDDIVLRTKQKQLLDQVKQLKSKLLPMSPGSRQYADMTLQVAVLLKQAQKLQIKIDQFGQPGSPKPIAPHSTQRPPNISPAAATRQSAFVDSVRLHLKEHFPNDPVKQSQMFSLAKNMTNHKMDHTQQRFVDILKNSADPAHKKQYKAIEDLSGMIEKQQQYDRKLKQPSTVDKEQSNLQKAAKDAPAKSSDAKLEGPKK